ncbi:MAG TPA: hypothetical protein VK142_05205 [Bacillota bacterium]|nr:hypothetical protein [Bacillota bacterium]
MISPKIDMALNIILSIALVVAVFIFIKNRKVRGKAIIPSICLFMVAFINLIGLWFDLLGIISVALTLAFLGIGAYFTKYLPRYK